MHAPPPDRNNGYIRVEVKFGFPSFKKKRRGDIPTVKQGFWQIPINSHKYWICKTCHFLRMRVCCTENPNAADVKAEKQQTHALAPKNASVDWIAK